MTAPRRSAAWYPILAVALAATAGVLIKTGRDAVFFDQGGLRQLPLAYILMAALSVPGAMVHLLMIRRFGARAVRSGVLLSAALLFSCFVPFVDPDHDTAMLILYSLVPATFAAVFAGAWLLAGDLLEGADAETMRWAYSRIGAGSMLGGIVGGSLARQLSPSLEPRFLVAAGAGMLVTATAVVLWAHRTHPANVLERAPESPQNTERARVKTVSGDDSVRARIAFDLLNDPYVRGLAGISVVSAAAGLFIDFQFYAAATLSGHVDAQFFGSFYAVLNAAALGLQLFAAPRIQSKFGIGGALMVLPLALLGGVTSTVLLSTTVLSRSILKVTESGLKSAIHRSSWEQVFLPIGGTGREMVKVMVDGLIARLAEGGAAVALYVWLGSISKLDANVNLSWISWAIVAAVLVWISLTSSLARRNRSRADEVDPMIRLPES